jgi:ferredoxin
MLRLGRSRASHDEGAAVKTLRIDPIACDGHGLCAELFPEWIELDDWGYPILDGRPVPPGLEQHARRAVKDCPKLALRLEAQRRVK